MAQRVVIAPTEEVGGSTKPKYFAGRLTPAVPELAGVVSTAIFYGRAPWCIVGADLSAAQVTFLQAQSDVRVIPANLDSTVTGGQVATVRAYLRAAAIPSLFVQGNSTWRAVLRVVGGLFLFAGRYAALTGGQTLLPQGADLDAAWSTVPQQRRDSVLATAASFTPPYDLSSVTDSTPIEDVLKLLGDQWGNQPLILGQLTI